MTDTAHGLGRHGFRSLKAVNWNLSVPSLYEEAIRRGEVNGTSFDPRALNRAKPQLEIL